MSVVSVLDTDTYQTPNTLPTAKCLCYKIKREQVHISNPNNVTKIDVSTAM
jgi:hypothetical protein